MQILAAPCRRSATLLHCRSPFICLRFERVDNLGAYSIPSGDRPSHPICSLQLFWKLKARLLTCMVRMHAGGARRRGMSSHSLMSAKDDSRGRRHALDPAALSRASVASRSITTEAKQVFIALEQ